MTKNKKSKVVIAGAGIGGLTTAHELVKRGFEVDIYERNPIVGGLARSRYQKNTKNGKVYPTEYSWRIYGTNYRNLLRILKEIPLKGRRNKSVFNQLRQIATYVFPRFGEREIVVHHNEHQKELMAHFRKHDWSKMLNKILYCLTMSNARIDHLDSLKWADFCRDLSPEAKKFMVRMWSPVLGMDSTKMSFSVMARMISILSDSLLNDVSSLYLLNGPTNDAWFDVWVEHLKKQGVKIHTEHDVEHFDDSDGRLTGIQVKDKQNSKRIAVEADYFVCSLPVESAATIVKKSSFLSSKSDLKTLKLLSKKSHQIQLSVQIFLNKEILYPITPSMVLYLPDTPWALIIEAQDKIWNNLHCTDKRVKSILSVGICQTDAKGILHKKPFTACSQKEIEEEVWAQILRSYEKSSIQTKDGEPFESAEILYFYMWDSFQCHPRKKEIEVWEPKFSNNAGTLALQPKCETTIPNFFFATAYTQTERFVYSMEAAAEAGTRAANTIIQKHNASQDDHLAATQVYGLAPSSLFLMPLAAMDRLLYALRLPHLSKLFFGSSIVLVVFYAFFILTLVISLIYSFFHFFL